MLPLLNADDCEVVEVEESVENSWLANIGEYPTCCQYLRLLFFLFATARNFFTSNEFVDPNEII